MTLMLGGSPPCSDTPVFFCINLAKFSMASMASGCCCSLSNKGFSDCHPRSSQWLFGASEAWRNEVLANALRLDTGKRDDEGFGKRGVYEEGEADEGDALEVGDLSTARYSFEVCEAIRC